MSRLKTFSIKEVRERVFDSLDFEGCWGDWIGKPQRNFKMLLAGQQKSGKSTFAIRLANYLADNFGKTLYNSHEEGLSKTFQDRLISNSINSPHLFLGHKLSFEDMMGDSFKKRFYKFVIIDSLQYMHLSYEQYQALVERYPKKGWIFISQVNGKGGIKGGTDISHAVDVMIYTRQGGKAHIESRYAESKTIQIFETKPKNGEQLPLITG